MAKQVGKVSKSADNYKGTANRYGVSYSFDKDDTPPYEVSWAGVSVFVVSDEEYSKNPSGEAYDDEQGSTIGIAYYDSLQEAGAMLKDAMSCANHDIVIDASLSDSDKKYLADNGIVEGKAGMQYSNAKAREKACEANPKSESVEAAFGDIGNSSNDTSKGLGE